MNDQNGNTSWQNPAHYRIRSAWNPAKLSVRRRLTDKQIEKYQKLGYYSAEIKQARRDLAKLRENKKTRVGNFLHGDGGLIYSPR